VLVAVEDADDLVEQGRSTSFQRSCPFVGHCDGVLDDGERGPVAAIDINNDPVAGFAAPRCVVVDLGESSFGEHSDDSPHWALRRPGVA
jgi:hypothetical protein